jgi:uncharacterized sporulation protein YeaH/YhbH (DUF444 family)
MPTARSRRAREAVVPFRKEDLIYKRLVMDEREESNAVVICVMDTSGSMDRLKKYLARSFFFLLYQFSAPSTKRSKSSSSPTIPRRRR